MTAAATALGPPPGSPAREYRRLVDLCAAGNLAVLTGAGISTESGIPDYRGPDGQRRVQPMTYDELLGSPAARRRYWARAYAGWMRFTAAVPNVGHRCVTQLQRAGLVGGVITQNVDGLHQRAGTREVLELHGSLARVVCLSCGDHTTRADVQERLRALNPTFGSVDGVLRPDGDVVLDDEVVARFTQPTCLACGSDVVKPDVVFFGESVPRDDVAEAFARVESADGLLVLGSSLRVMSGYRFVRRAAALGQPVAIVTRGVSRGDGEATIRVDASLGSTLAAVVDDLGF